jgi:hypothetical protein
VFERGGHEQCALSPRTAGEGDTPFDGKIRRAAAIKNTLSNAWAIDQDFVVGKDFSYFNHSCLDSNAVIVNWGRFPCCEDYSAPFLAVYSTRNIQKGDEVTFFYNEMAGHGNDAYDFDCRCGASLEYRNRRREDDVRVGDACRERDSKLIGDLIRRYLLSPPGLKTCAAQRCAVDGLFFNENVNVVVPGFMDLLKEKGITLEDYVDNVWPGNKRRG